MQRGTVGLYRNDQVVPPMYSYAVIPIVGECVVYKGGAHERGRCMEACKSTTALSQGEAGTGQQRTATAY